jgi:hypothetical protein
MSESVSVREGEGEREGERERGREGGRAGASVVTKERRSWEGMLPR